jgi:hypothetical protein
MNNNPTETSKKRSIRYTLLVAHYLQTNGYKKTASNILSIVKNLPNTFLTEQLFKQIFDLLPTKYKEMKQFEVNTETFEIKNKWELILLIAMTALININTKYHEDFKYVKKVIKSEECSLP